MRSIFASLKLPNLPSLLLLPKQVMSLRILHTLPLLVHESSILVHLIISLVIRISSFLTITSPSPMISLANGTQTMAKGFGLACPFPFLPLNYVLYGLDSPFNLISICKLIRDLHCSITFFNSSVTLQDQSTGNTIGIEYESQARLKISVSTDISILRFYGYIGYIGDISVDIFTRISIYRKLTKVL